MKPVVRRKNGVRNRVLASLPKDDFSRLQRMLEPMEMHRREWVYEPNTPFGHVYFPEFGVGSVVTVLQDGTEVEVATIGYEGMVGLPAFFGAQKSPGRAFWQIGGSAFRMSVKALLSETKDGGALTDALHLYTQALFNQLAQTATCNRLHSVEKRCCRWLLITHDRVAGDEFELTHEFLGQMLAVRRSSITVVAGKLQDAGLIRYRRGVMTVIHREKLERAACECYRVVRAEFDRLLG